MIERELEPIAFSPEFGRQMRFVVGPRQTGKTTLAKHFLKKVKFSPLYYNWDLREIKTAYQNDADFFMKDVYKYKGQKKKVWLCFDEIHKMPKWKNILKGVFDSYEDLIHFIVTGSAKLDLLKYTGESLLGRYFAFRLFPLRLSELNSKHFSINKKILNEKTTKIIESILSINPSNKDSFDQLLHRSGFPEPFLSDSDLFLTKWRNDYLDHYIKEDLRDLTNIHELENVFNLITLLPSKIGNPLSLNSLKEDLEVSHTAVRTWLKALKLSYVIFSIKPYTKKIVRSLKKGEKCYFFDWTRAGSEGAIFENYIAVELFTFCAMLTDAGFGKYNLHYVKTKDGLETDFLITQNDSPWILFECKLQDTTIEKHHINTSIKLGNIPVVQLIKRPDVIMAKKRTYFTVSANHFLENLKIEL